MTTDSFKIKVSLRFPNGEFPEGVDPQGVTRDIEKELNELKLKSNSKSPLTKNEIPSKDKSTGIPEFYEFMVFINQIIENINVFIENLDSVLVAFSILYSSIMKKRKESKDDIKKTELNVTINNYTLKYPSDRDKIDKYIKGLKSSKTDEDENRK